MFGNLRNKVKGDERGGGGERERERRRMETDGKASLTSLCVLHSVTCGPGT